MEKLLEFGIHVTTDTIQASVRLNSYAHMDLNLMHCFMALFRNLTFVIGMLLLRNPRGQGFAFMYPLYSKLSLIPQVTIVCGLWNLK